MRSSASSESRPRGLAANTTTMKCAQCGAESPAGMKFCGQCGAPLVSTCPSCGADNPPEHKFCGHCGSLFVSSAPLAVSVAAATTVRCGRVRKTKTKGETKARGRLLDLNPLANTSSRRCCGRQGAGRGKVAVTGLRCVSRRKNERSGHGATSVKVHSLSRKCH